MYDKTKLDEGIEKLTGNDLHLAENRFKATHRDFFGVIQLESGFFAEVAALALGQNVHELQALPIREYFGIITETQRFLNEHLGVENLVSN